MQYLAYDVPLESYWALNILLMAYWALNVLLVAYWALGDFITVAKAYSALDISFQATVDAYWGLGNNIIAV